MVTISKDNIITMSRGDSWSAPLFLNKGTALTPIRKILTNDDKVYLAIMEPNQPFEDAIVKKTYTNQDVNINNDVVVSITPTDTECLIPGKYFYQIKAKFVATDLVKSDTTISSSSTLKAGSRVIKDSIINGVTLTQDYTTLSTDTTLTVGDLIKRFSEIQTGSTINGTTSTVRYDVNTVVQKTQFNIVE